ncbi:MAG: tetratricopeptide repeat protein, partial [Kiritimatiellaeota bacterium]|nr:tetratricopeptide repeat protein [Kiritimatiellota bacterium]
MKKNRDVKSSGMILVLCATHACACGPFFPNRLLENGDAAVTQAPVAVFAEELARLSPTNAALFKAKGLPDDELKYREAVLRLDLKEFAEVMRQGAGFSPVEFAAYQKARESIFKYDQTLLDSNGWDRRGQRKPRPALVAPVVPEGRGLAREFSAYLRGSVLWYQGQTNAAIGAWSELLTWPMEERHQRSTWAAFMLGKAYLGQGQNAKAIAQFQQVRRLARDGLADVLGLAASSYGWEARAELDQKNFGRALALYLDHLAAGDASATNSLKFAAARAWELPAAQRTELVKQTPARRVLVAYALSQHESYGGPVSESWQTFLTAVEAAGIPIMEEADRLAWAAYRAGDMKLAARFLVLAPRDSVMAQLVASKLLLRAGRVQEAMDALAKIAKRFPDAPAAHGYNMLPDDPPWEPFIAK